MANDVRNEFSVEGSEKNKKKLSVAIDHLIKALKKMILVSVRRKFESDESFVILLAGS